jgi:site-specific DNA recombinase
MFKAAWNQQAQHTAKLIQASRQKIITIEKQIDQLVDRIVETTVPSAVAHYEQRIAQLEKEKLLMEDSLDKTPPPGRFEELFELSLQFLENPHKLWALGRLEHKRTVLKLAFSDRLSYNRKTGLRTPKTALLFKVLGGFYGGNLKVVGGTGFEPVTPSV